MPNHTRSCAGVATDRPQLEVAAIVRDHLEAYRNRYALSAAQEVVVRDLVRCRTAALGGHLEVCTHCGFERPAYNSCRNRHCPKCQALAQARWVDRRLEQMLPTHHFHVVFTLPAELHSVAQANRALVFDLLIQTAAGALLALGRDPKWFGVAAQLGLTAVLHTWSRELGFHPHVHCIVTGGGLALDQSRWIAAKPDFLFPVHVLGALFRGKVLAGLEQARKSAKLVVPKHEDGRAWRRRFKALYDKTWVVYVKRPFGGPEQVYRYLGRYTHRVAISNARLVRADERAVCFRTRGENTVTVGLMASGAARSKRQRARQLLEPIAGSASKPHAPSSDEDDDDCVLDWRELYRTLTGDDLLLCPQCGQRAIVRMPLPVTTAASCRGPPDRLAA